MAAIAVRRNVFLSPIKPLLSLQGLYHKSVEVGDAKPRLPSYDDYLIFKPGEIDVSKWKKMDSRSLGITQAMIPQSPHTVLKILRTRGFEAYLVGGCVRDLLLNRTPKDFDVITTADLDQISKQFHRCEVVGRRFPICRVHIKGSIVEVSSFDTLAKDAEGKEKFLLSQMPRGCDKSDLVRWKNSMHRDFTINSLFFDPFVHKIYDYNDGMKDLLEQKLQTLVPAQLSFAEDSARILRGLRIAARLGLSLSKEIKIAILKQTSSVSRLGQFRIMMELNYMLSFGAAESSFSLLHKYHLLEILLPFQAAYISQQSTRSGQSSMMLMKLLSHLDKLVTCGCPSGSRLWIGLLGFHLALVKNPQHPFVVLTFASVLYHQNWEDGLKFARKYGRAPVRFEPEISEPYEFISDVEVAKKVNQLVLLVLDSIDVLVETDDLHKTMVKFTGSPCSGLVFIPKNLGHSAGQLFHVLAHKVETYKKGRTSFEINYDLLAKGDSIETRFALGKIILNTMGCGVDCVGDPNEDNYRSPSSPKNEHLVNKKEDRKQPPVPSSLNLQQGSAPKKQKLIAKLSSIMHRSPEQNEYQMEQDEPQEGLSTKHTKVVGISSHPENEERTTDKQEICTSQSPMPEMICMVETLIDNEKSPFQLEVQNLEERHEGNSEVELDESIAELQRGTRLLEREENDEIVVGACMKDASQSPMQEMICMVETLIDNEKSPSQLEVQNLEERLEGNTEVEIDKSLAELQRGTRLLEREVENDETGVGALLWSIQTNFNRAIDEARYSPADMRKLNQFLVSFVEEQMQRKKAKQLEASSLVSSSICTSQAKSMQLEASSSVSSIGASQAGGKQLGVSSLVSSIGSQQKESEQSEASRLVSSSIGTSEADSRQLESSRLVASSITISQMESSPHICVQHPEEPKTTRQPKKATRMKSSVQLSMVGERKKQRACSYCKEMGHNRTGCPKRKVNTSTATTKFTIF